MCLSSVLLSLTLSAILRTGTSSLVTLFVGGVCRGGKSGEQGALKGSGELVLPLVCGNQRRARGKHYRRREGLINIFAKVLGDQRLAKGRGNDAKNSFDIQRWFSFKEGKSVFRCIEMKGTIFFSSRGKLFAQSSLPLRHYTVKIALAYRTMGRYVITVG